MQKALVERYVTRIELPADVIGEDLPSEHFAHPLIHKLPRTAPSAGQVAKAAEILNDGKRVAIFCGVGCRDARNEVLALAESLQSPIVHTLRAKDIFETSEDLHPELGNELLASRWHASGSRYPAAHIWPGLWPSSADL